MLSATATPDFSTASFPTTNIALTTVSAAAAIPYYVRFKFRPRHSFLCKSFNAEVSVSGSPDLSCDQPSVILDSLRVLQWDQLCDCVSSFAGTSAGKQATKKQLWTLDKTYEDSIRLLEETNAAVEMQKYGAMIDFTGIDIDMVQTAIRCAHRCSPVSGSEAIAILSLLKYAEMLQLNVKAAIKQDSDWYLKFSPLSAMIIEVVINPSLINFIEDLIDEDGSVKDSASSNLRMARDRVRFLERKLYQLIESMIRNEMEETSSMEVSNVDGRWCIRSSTNMHSTFEGLLLSSNSDTGNLVEPLYAVPLNDELQQARLSVAKAEADVLLKITKKMQVDLGDIQNLCNDMIQLDMINARAQYSTSYDGSWPDLYHPDDKVLKPTQLTQRKWTMYLPKAYHPLLCIQYRHKLQKAVKHLSNANAEVNRRKQQGGNPKVKEKINMNVSSLEMEVSMLKQSPPIPFDIFVEHNKKVLVITGPNTGGKTICLKTIGLAAMMAKSGLYVLASEPARIPWFDSVFADIGDEQSLTQSLSTFSGHLKQISEIKSLSTGLSLVLLDEVGAGTNPLEGAALGMSVLESFANAGALLTIATTHHGELKTLKYSNYAFENACMEFDEANLKPTYRILWGIPGRSNAINIAERLGMPIEILDNARKLYGAASAEINEVIVDMERFRKDYHEQIHKSQNYLRLAKNFHERLLVARKRVMEYATERRHRMIQEISEAAAIARSMIHKKARQSRSTNWQPPQQREADKAIQTNNLPSLKENMNSAVSESPIKGSTTSEATEIHLEENATFTTSEFSTSNSNTSPNGKGKLESPKIGDCIYVPNLNKKATVLTMDPSKGELVVQAGTLKLKLKLSEILT